MGDGANEGLAFVASGESLSFQAVQWESEGLLELVTEFKDLSICGL